MRTRTHVWHVYGLYDPRTGEMRYIGCTDNPEARLSQHVASARGGSEQCKAKREWIMELLSDGYTPELRTLHSSPNKYFAFALERSLQEIHAARLFKAPRGPVGGSRDPAVLMAVIALLSQELHYAAKVISRSAKTKRSKQGRENDVWTAGRIREKLDDIRREAGLIPINPVKRKRLRLAASA